MLCPPSLRGLLLNPVGRALINQWEPDYQKTKGKGVGRLGLFVHVHPSMMTFEDSSCPPF